MQRTYKHNPAALSEQEAQGTFSLPVATTSPGAVALLEILPEEYGFSEVCKCRCKEQKGYKGEGGNGFIPGHS